ncbi:MAG: hypothetical protein K9L59_10135 [Desulfobacterales bacterium]|nr:hypothetical protein [Desulfobacterales bacterium]
MGNIKDLVDLITALSDRTENRKFSADLREVQSQVLALQSEHAELHEHRIQLMTENTELKQTIAALNQEKVDLHKQIAELQTPRPRNENDLSDEAIAILSFIAKNEHCLADHICRRASISKNRVELWLSKLVEIKLISSQKRINSPARYKVAPKGLEFLLKRGLI